MARNLMAEKLRSAATDLREVFTAAGVEDAEHADLLDAAATEIDELAEKCREVYGMHDVLQRRLMHLLQSRTIRMYDSRMMGTGEYMKNIDELDARMSELCSIEEEYKERKAQEEVKNAAADTEPLTRAGILERAAAAVCGEREQDYGKPEDNFATIAHLWTAYADYEFDAVDVAMMMALLKVARIKSGHGSDDSFIDLAGYAACGGEIAAKMKSAKAESAWMDRFPRYSSEEWEKIREDFERSMRKYSEIKFGREEV